MLLQPLISLGLATAALACGNFPRQDGAGGMVKGPNKPADPATTGTFLNHISINVNDLNQSIKFYSEVFGFRHLFTVNLTQHVSFTYMSHSQGGRNGTGYQTVEEMARHKNNNAGHLEFFHRATPGEPFPGSLQPKSPLSHIGIIVPDLQATQDRLEAYNVTIFKKIAAPMPTTGPLGNKSALGDVSNFSDEEFAELQAVMTVSNSETIFAADPDGNLLEILSLYEPNIFGPDA